MRQSSMIEGRHRLNEPAVVSETIDGEAVIINLDKGSYYSLRDSGAHIWSLLEQGTTTGDLVADVQHRYLGDPGQVRAAVLDFLSELAQEELIRCDEAATADAAGDGAVPTCLGANGHERRPFVRPVLDKYTDMEHLLLLDPIHEIDETGWIHMK
jgi:hypothetical protein